MYYAKILLHLSLGGIDSPDYGQIYTLLSRVMRGQPPPNLSPLGKWISLSLPS